MKKILFLDIDGVLNSEDWYKSDKAQALRFPIEGQKLDRNDPKYHAFHFDPFKIELLEMIIASTGCEIVISSSWRKNREIETLQTIFKNMNFKYWKNIIGKTGNFYSWLKEGVHCPSVRGLEIRVWLEKNIKNQNPTYASPNTYTYCILDDDSDMLLEQKNNFIQTGQKEGLTTNLARKTINILNDTTRINK